MQVQVKVHSPPHLANGLQAPSNADWQRVERQARRKPHDRVGSRATRLECARNGDGPASLCSQTVRHSQRLPREPGTQMPPSGLSAAGVVLATLPNSLVRTNILPPPPRCSAGCPQYRLGGGGGRQARAGTPHFKNPNGRYLSNVPSLARDRRYSLFLNACPTTPTAPPAATPFHLPSPKTCCTDCVAFPKGQLLRARQDNALVFAEVWSGLHFGQRH